MRPGVSIAEKKRGATPGRKKMSVEYLAEKIFLEEVTTAGEVWVARGPHKNIYAQEIENYAYSLPTWSSRDRIDEYLKVTRLLGKFEPHAIPLDVFANRWLSDQSMAISEVQINPIGKATRVLALTNEEFQAEAFPG
jgi:hypothetical protein